MNESAITRSARNIGSPLKAGTKLTNQFHVDALRAQHEYDALGSIKSAKDKVVKISNKAEVFSLVFVKSKLNGNSN
jgi:hypothetical protein